MRELAATEHDRYLDLVSVPQEADGILQLDVKIMLLDIGTKLYFLDRNDLLLLLGFFFPFLLFISVLAEIHDAAYRRLSLRSNLHEIQMLLHRHVQSIFSRHDAELFAARARHANLTDANLFINSK